MSRLKELDSLRGVACIFVLLFHYTTQYAKIFNTTLTVNFLDFKYGGLGVDLFFIISGFVIYLTIIKTKSPSDFLFKRFSRLYPTFWICVFLTFIIVNISNVKIYQRDFSELIVNLTMIPDVFGVKRIDGVYWSLLPELAFYLAMFFLLLIKKVKKIEIISFVWLFLILMNSLSDVMPIRVLLNLKFGYLFIMGMNFYKIKLRESNWIHHLLIWLSYGISFLVFEPSIKHLILLFFTLVFYLFAYDKLVWFTFKPLVKLGQISYALYLIHQFVGYVIISRLIELGIHNSFLLLLIPATITILLALLITDYIEKPVQIFLRNRRKK